MDGALLPSLVSFCFAFDVLAVQGPKSTEVKDESSPSAAPGADGTSPVFACKIIATPRLKRLII